VPIDYCRVFRLLREFAIDDTTKRIKGNNATIYIIAYNSMSSSPPIDIRDGSCGPGVQGTVPRHMINVPSVCRYKIDMKCAATMVNDVPAYTIMYFVTSLEFTRDHEIRGAKSTLSARREIQVARVNTRNTANFMHGVNKLQSGEKGYNHGGASNRSISRIGL
jgi:hypothetical protein